MADIIEVIDGLPELLATGSADMMSIETAERALNINFANEYKEYLVAYGSILADDIELTGIAKSETRYVVTVTKKEWELNLLVDRNLYVVENLGIDGIVIWQNEEGHIFESLVNEQPKKIANSLAEYIVAKY